MSSKTLIVLLILSSNFLHAQEVKDFIDELNLNRIHWKYGSRVARNNSKTFKLVRKDAMAYLSPEYLRYQGFESPPIGGAFQYQVRRKTIGEATKIESFKLKIKSKEYKAKEINYLKRLKHRRWENTVIFIIEDEVSIGEVELKDGNTTISKYKLKG